MRLLITTDTIGGVWTFTQELTTGLLEKGHAVLLVSFGRMPNDAQQSACDEMGGRFGSAFRYVASNTPLEWMDANESAYTEGATLLAREAALFGPDLMHSNQFCFGAKPIPLPRIVTAHSDVLSWAKACRKEALPDTPWLRRYMKMVQDGVQAADAVVAPTQWMLDALRDSFRIGGETRVILNGHKSPRFEERARTLQAVTAGRLWDEAKDVLLLKDVQSPMPILVAGDTQHQDAQVVLEGSSLRLLGQLGEAEMSNLLESSAVYVCSSRYEPFGLAPLEAAQCGCAVVVRDIPSLREVWRDAALYFSDAAELSRILQELYGSPELLSEARRRSAEHARTFTRERMVAQYLDLYRHIVTSTSRSQHVA